MKKIFSALIVLFVGVWAYSVYALPATCQITGNISQIYGLTSASTGSNVRVAFKGVNLQNPPSGSIIPGGSSCSVFTDVNGNLPTTGNCVNFLQGAIMQVTIGDGQPTQIQVPIQASADLSTLILANTDPPGLISSISVTAGGDYVLNVTNPAAGSVGSAVLAPGNVTGWAGEKIPTGVPTSGAIPVFTATAGGQWSFPQFAYGGTFTPQVWAGAVPTPTLTYFNNQGFYEVIGNTVLIWYVVNYVYVSSGPIGGGAILCLNIPSGVPTPLGTPGNAVYDSYATIGGITLSGGFTSAAFGGNAFAVQTCPVEMLQVGSGQAAAAIGFNQATPTATVEILGQINYRWQ